MICDLCHADVPAFPCDTCFPITRWSVATTSGNVVVTLDSREAAYSSRDALEALQRRPLASYVVTVAKRGISPQAEAALERWMKAQDEANARTWNGYDPGRCDCCDRRGHTGSDCPTWGPDLVEERA